MKHITGLSRLGVLLAALLMSACSDIWNNPYPAGDRGQNVLYTSFSERPKTLDPAVTFASN